MEQLKIVSRNIIFAKLKYYIFQFSFDFHYIFLKVVNNLSTPSICSYVDDIIRGGPSEIGRIPLLRV